MHGRSAQKDGAGKNEESACSINPIQQCPAFPCWLTASRIPAKQAFRLLATFPTAHYRLSGGL
jgi:hypothetical protein